MFNPKVGQKFTYFEGSKKFTGKFVSVDKAQNYFMLKWDHNSMNGTYSFTDTRFTDKIKLVLKEKKLPEWF